MNIDGGVPLSLYHYNKKNASQYCCGTAALTSGDLGCQLGGGPFTIEPADAIWGKGFLNSESATGDPNQTESTNGGTGRATTVAVGAGIGVPLGLLSIVMLSWALWERKRRRDEAARLRPTPAATPYREKTRLFGRGERGPFRPPVCELGHEREPAELN